MPNKSFGIVKIYYFVHLFVGVWFLILIYFWKNTLNYSTPIAIIIFALMAYWLYDLLKQLTYRVVVENGIMKEKGLFSYHREIAINTIQNVRFIYYYNFRLREAKSLLSAHLSQWGMLLKIHNTLAGLFYGSADRMVMVNFDQEQSKIPFPAQPVNPKIVGNIKENNPGVIIQKDENHSVIGTFFGRILLVLIIALTLAVIYAYAKII